ncbi:protein SON-like isoform X2 [Pomacea canaliculata]|uniref:protein SON-like isoform X2 n=1 Tax=Pomacea canaliculata TaxID=400727 RepID=UPI000D733B18|nr:protein SON-like isoform X2 [Pomacea canaliculata]
MADLSFTSSSLPGEKRKLSSKTLEKRAIKHKRFDTIQQQKLSEDASSCSSSTSATLLSLDSSPACSTGALLPVQTERENTLGAGMLKSISLVQSRTSDSFCAAQGASVNKPSVNMLLRNSLEQSRAKSGIEDCSNTHDSASDTCDQAARAKGSQTSIVDELFKEFIAAKMKQVSNGSNNPSVKLVPSACRNEHGAASDDPDPLAVSMEEINRLLDAEITFIQSRSTASLQDMDSENNEENSCTETLTAAHSPGHLPSEFLASDLQETATVSASTKIPVHRLSALVSDLNSGIERNEKPVKVSTLSCHLPTLENKDGVTLAAETITEVCLPGTNAEKNNIQVMVSGDSEGRQGQRVESRPVSLLGKKPQVKKLDIAIRQESLALIMGAAKMTSSKTLKDGEVASSSDIEEDKPQTASPKEKEDNASDENEVSETGSLSDTDEDKSGDKGSSKSKKKKKHKHKHKKKKKHKSQSKDRKEQDKHSLEKEMKIAKNKIKDGKTRNDAEGATDKKHSKERRGSGSSKISHSCSRSPSQSKKERRSRSPRNSHRTRSQSKERKRSRERFDPWDARNYRDRKCSSHHSKRTQSRSRSRSHNRSCDRSRRRSRDRSSEKKQHRSHGRYRSHDPERSSHEKEDHKDSLDDLRIRIDKNKLRKIAIANALANMESGQGPPVDISTIKCGGKSIAELTDFCKRISEREKEQQAGHLSDSGSSDAEANTSEAEDSLIHHPFKLRDPSTVPNIIMNIRNAKQLPVLSPQEKQAQAAVLRSQFPVSSGVQHRTKESEWVPVTPTTAVTATTVTTTSSTPSVITTFTEPVRLSQTLPMNQVPATPAEQSVFPEVIQQSIDIGSIISERLQAVRKLQENPFDVQALSSMHKAQEKANQWAASKQLPGQFLGSTGVQCLTPQELAGPDKRNQAWARKVVHRCLLMTSRSI